MDRENVPIDGIQVNQPASSPERMAGIQAEKPILPWERPGYFRLDGEPHRGDSLWWFAFGSCLFSGLASMPIAGWMFGLLALTPCFVIRQMARRDLAKMRTGLIDPRGRAVTATAEEFARVGVWISLGGILFWGSVCLVLRLF